MSLIFLAFGAFLYFTGKLSIGRFKAEGNHVKRAGLVLMSPAIGSFLVSLVLGLLFARNMQALFTVLNIMVIAELVAAVVAANIAYRLIFNPAGSRPLPGILGQWQAEAKSATPSTAPEPNLQKLFKPVLTLEEAAVYLGVTPAQVTKLIEDGKLAAARVNYRYQIARMALDELLNAPPVR
jgi:excisionase family DNA binding protein